MMLKRIALAAALALGPLLFTGAGLADTDPPKTYGDAMRWYKQAARAGNPRAQFFLGLMYERGINVKEDATAAASWFAKAAAQGHAEAQFKLALMYEKGAGVPMSAVQAARWYREAAKAGLGAAQYNLGVLYANGEGVGRDDVLAYMWLDLAAGNGLKQAKAFRDSLSRRMTPADIAAAKKRVRARRPKGK